MKPHICVAAAIVFAALPLANPATCTAQSAATTVQDILFHSVDADLSGTVLIPSMPIAGVVWVDGSGQTSRNEGLARYLAGNRIAVLAYDKRGVGRSGGVYAGPEVGTNNVDPNNLTLLAQDVDAAVVELQRALHNPNIPIGLLGGSQAGWIVPLAAQRSPDVKFMVLWVGPLVTTREQLRFQFFTEQRSDFWDHHTEDEVRTRIGDAKFDRYEFVDIDPRDALKNLSIPGLWLFGGRDLNTPTQISVERLQALIANGKPFAYKVFPMKGHQLGFDAFPTTIDWIRQLGTQ